MPIIPLLHMEINLICIFINIYDMKTLKMCFTNGGIRTRSILSQLLLVVEY